MNLVNELQISAEQDDVLMVLRKAVRLASKLNRQDISDWLRSEQSGYAVSQSVPDYRMIRVSLALNTNGYVPAGFGCVMNGVQHLPPAGVDGPVWVGNSISTVQAWIADLDNDRGIYLPVERTEMDKAVRAMYSIHPMFARQVSFLLRLNDAEVRAVPERIKDKVLEWACVLERAGVTGEGMSFTAKEKEIAHAITYNISGSNIEQLNNLGTNMKGHK